MDLFIPFKEMVNKREYASAHHYLEFLEAENLGFKDFADMPGRIALFKLALQRLIQLPAHAFTLNMGDRQKGNLIAQVFKAEVARSWAVRDKADTADFIERAGSTLVQLVDYLTHGMIENYRDAAKREYIERIYKGGGSKFPMQIILESKALEQYRDVILEIDLGL